MRIYTWRRNKGRRVLKCHVKNFQLSFETIALHWFTRNHLDFDLRTAIMVAILKVQKSSNLLEKAIKSFEIDTGLYLAVYPGSLLVLGRVEKRHQKTCEKLKFTPAKIIFPRATFFCLLKTLVYAKDKCKILREFIEFDGPHSFVDTLSSMKNCELVSVFDDHKRELTFK